MLRLSTFILFLPCPVFSWSPCTYNTGGMLATRKLQSRYNNIIVIESLGFFHSMAKGLPITNKELFRGDHVFCSHPWAFSNLDRYEEKKTSDGRWLTVENFPWTPSCHWKKNQIRKTVRFAQKSTVLNENLTWEKGEPLHWKRIEVKLLKKFRLA